MKLVINSTDFSAIGTALYYNNQKFLPSWIYSDKYPSNFLYGGDIDMPNDLNSARGYENTYFSVDSGKYYAFTTPELFTSTISLVKDQYKYLSVYYHGSKNKILSQDFAEYDFSFLVDKYKFNNNLKIQLLDKDSKDIIGYKPEELSKLENILFPSLLYNTASGDSRNYFGTTVIGTYTLFLFPVPAGVRKVELYEGTLLDLEEAGYNYDYRNLEYQLFNPQSSYPARSKVIYEGRLWEAKVRIQPGEWNADNWVERNYLKPSLSVYFGPEYMWSCCDSSMYMTNPSTWDNGFRYLPISKKYLRGMDEITSEKILWMVITDSGQLFDINLSYNSWSTDKINPERNKWKYSLRNDEFWSTKDNMPLLKEKSGIILDGRSDTILSTQTVNSHPILSRKMRKFDLNYYESDKVYYKGDRIRYLGKLWEALVDVPINITPEEGNYWKVVEQFYSPYCTYRLGERVLFNGRVWESLTDLNLGNRPDYSRQWILSDSTTNFFTNRVNIIINPSGAGRITPGGQVRIDEELPSKSFSVFESLGYTLESADKVCSSEIGTYLDNVNITTSNISTEGGTMDKKEVTVSNNSWDSIISTGKLIFNFKSTPTIITLVGIYDNVEYPYSSWLFNSERIQLKRVPSGNVSNTISISPGSELTLLPRIDLVNNRFTKVISTYKDRYGVIKTKELELTNNEIKDFIDFSSATYTFYIEKNKMSISCIIGLAEFEMEDNKIEIDYNSTGNFKFYPRNPDIDSPIKVTINELDTITILSSQTITYSRPGATRSIPRVCNNYTLVSHVSYYDLEFEGLIGDVNIKIEYDN
jgi:hypothetical protein